MRVLIPCSRCCAGALGVMPAAIAGEPLGIPMTRSCGSDDAEAADARSPKMRCWQRWQTGGSTFAALPLEFTGLSAKRIAGGGCRPRRSIGSPFSRRRSGSPPWLTARPRGSAAAALHGGRAAAAARSRCRCSNRPLPAGRGDRAPATCSGCRWAIASCRRMPSRDPQEMIGRHAAPQPCRKARR